MPPPSPSQRQEACSWTALPLVLTDANTDALRIGADAFAFLRTLRAPTAHVLGVYGPPRTGKRLLLRTLLCAPIAALGDNVVSRTNGARVLLWLWLPPQDNDDDAEDAHAQTQARLVVACGDLRSDRDRRRGVALLLLLSSTLLYNEDGEVDARALDRLTWLRDVSSSLRVRPTQDDDAVVRDFHKHAPSLLWLVRNGKRKWLADADSGDKRSPTEYLERCLVEEPGFSDTVMARNAQRMLVHSFFRARECVILGRAVDGADEDPAVEATTPRDGLRPAFVEAVDKLFATYLSERQTRVPPRTLLGRELKAAQLVIVLQTHVNAINANVLPAVHTAAAAVTRATVLAVFEDAWRGYAAVMDSMTAAASPSDGQEGRTIGAREIQVAHLRSFQLAMSHVRLLHAQLPDVAKNPAYRESVDAFRRDVAVRMQAVVGLNEQRSLELCERMLADVLPSNLEPMVAELESSSRDSFSEDVVSLLMQYTSDLRSAVASYKTQAVGLALLPALEVALRDSVVESVKTGGASVLRQYQQHVRALLDELTQIEHTLEVAGADIAASVFSTEDQKRLHEEQLAQSTQQLSELRRVLQGELNDHRAELERLLSDMTTIERKYEARAKIMEGDLAWIRGRATELEKVSMDRRQQLEWDESDASEEVLVKERSFLAEERSLIAQQKELLDRVLEFERELVQRKTRHVQRVFALETDATAQLDALQHERAEFARHLKSQAKTDTGVLRLAYQKKKTVVQTEIDRVESEVQELRHQLRQYDTPRAAASREWSFGSATTSGTIAFASVSSESGGVGSIGGASAAGATAARPVTSTRSDTDMCKAQ